MSYKLDWSQERHKRGRRWNRNRDPSKRKPKKYDDVSKELFDKFFGSDVDDMVSSNVEDNGRLAVEPETEEEKDKKEEEDGVWEIDAVMVSDGLKEGTSVSLPESGTRALGRQQIPVAITCSMKNQ